MSTAQQDNKSIKGCHMFSIQILGRFKRHMSISISKGVSWIGRRRCWAHQQRGTSKPWRRIFSPPMRYRLRCSNKYKSKVNQTYKDNRKARSLRSHTPPRRKQAPRFSKTKLWTNTRMAQAYWCPWVKSISKKHHRKASTSILHKLSVPEIKL